MWHSTHKNILKLIRTNDCMIVENRSCSYVPAQHIISYVKECLLPRLIFVHVERIVDFSCENAMAPDLYCVYRRVEVFYFCLFQHPLLTDIVKSQTVTHTCEHFVVPWLQYHWNCLDLRLMEKLELARFLVPFVNLELWVL